MLYLIWGENKNLTETQIKKKSLSGFPVTFVHLQPFPPCESGAHWRGTFPQTARAACPLPESPESPRDPAPSDLAIMNLSPVFIINPNFPHFQVIFLSSRVTIAAKAQEAPGHDVSPLTSGCGIGERSLSWERLLFGDWHGVRLLSKMALCTARKRILYIR